MSRSAQTSEMSDSELREMHPVTSMECERGAILRILVDVCPRPSRPWNWLVHELARIGYQADSEKLDFHIEYQRQKGLVSGGGVRGEWAEVARASGEDHGCGHWSDRGAQAREDWGGDL